MYKVFIKDSSLSFVEKPSDAKGSFIEYQSAEQLQKYIKQLENNPNIEHITFVTPDPGKAWQALNDLYQIIEAAGGIVRNQNDEILMIFRLGKWDLPKGKLEEGESVQEGAVREVIEECGISGLRVLHELPMTYHTYRMGDENILKRTYWFEMKTEHNSDLVPQIEEHIEKAQWVNPDFLDEYLGNTYASIHWLLNRVFDKN